MTEPRYPSAFRVWDVLVREAGAIPSELDQFSYHWPQCVEYRFQGSLGFGGKVWAALDGRVVVNCYREDETPERLAIIERTNAVLEALR